MSDEMSLEDERLGHLCSALFGQHPWPPERDRFDERPVYEFNEKRFVELSLDELGNLRSTGEDRLVEMIDGKPYWQVFR